MLRLNHLAMGAHSTNAFKGRLSAHFCLLDVALKPDMPSLLQIEEQRQLETERAGRAVEERQAAHDELERVKTKLKAEGLRQNAAQQAFSEVTRAKLDSVSRHAQLELDIKELEDKKSSDAATQVRHNGVH